MSAEAAIRLLELRVQDFAIVERAQVSFGSGFNVLTGETGAGKSILVDALSVALGGRALAEVVRQGADEAQVEAIFEIGAMDPELAGLLAREGLDDPDESLLVLGRTVSASGRHQARVNGHPATARLLRDIGERLVDVHGQHEHHLLLSPQAQLDLLDAFAGDACMAARGRVAAAFRRWRSLCEEREQLGGDPRQRAREAEMLRFQVDEIEAAQIAPDEFDALEARRRVLQHAQRLYEVAAQAVNSLADADNAESAIVDLLEPLVQTVATAADIDDHLRDPAGVMREALTLLRDAARDLRAYRDGMQFEPGELARVEERLNLLHRLQAKYGETAADIMRHRDEAAATLEAWEHRDERAAELEGEIAAARAELEQQSQSLSALRTAAAATLQQTVDQELVEVAFPSDAFAVAVRQRAADAIDASGADDVAFLLAANPGEAPRPLRQVASGGELSRIMLALRAATASTGGAPVVVFDEIDAGVGGRTARAVAARLARLGERRQVLCVTHLAQIAAIAECHVSIQKAESGGRTRLRAERVAGEARVHEIARMLSGHESQTSLEHARTLLSGKS